MRIQVVRFYADGERELRALGDEAAERAGVESGGRGGASGWSPEVGGSLDGSPDAVAERWCGDRDGAGEGEEGSQCAGEGVPLSGPEVAAGLGARVAGGGSGGEGHGEEDCEGGGGARGVQSSQRLRPLRRISFAGDSGALEAISRARAGHDDRCDFPSPQSPGGVGRDGWAGEGAPDSCPGDSGGSGAGDDRAVHGPGYCGPFRVPVAASDSEEPRLNGGATATDWPRPAAAAVLPPPLPLTVENIQRFVAEAAGWLQSPPAADGSSGADSRGGDDTAAARAGERGRSRRSGLSGGGGIGELGGMSGAEPGGDWFGASFDSLAVVVPASPIAAARPATAVRRRNGAAAAARGAPMPATTRWEGAGESSRRGGDGGIDGDGSARRKWPRARGLDGKRAGTAATAHDSRAVARAGGSDGQLTGSSRSGSPRSRSHSPLARRPSLRPPAPGTLAGASGAVRAAAGLPPEANYRLAATDEGAGSGEKDVSPAEALLRLSTASLSWCSADV